MVAVAALDDGEILFQNELSSSFCTDTRAFLDVLFSLQPESEKQVRARKADPPMPNKSHNPVTRTACWPAYLSIHGSKEITWISVSMYSI